MDFWGFFLMFFPCSIKSRRCFYWIFFLFFVFLLHKIRRCRKKIAFIIYLFWVCFLVARGGGGIGIFFWFLWCVSFSL
jgi:hypothetical protein